MTGLTYDSRDLDTAVRTAWGEARGEGDAGLRMVLWVVRNRVEIDLGKDGRPDWWGEGVAAVCLKPLQFSCWNLADPNRAKLLRLPSWDPAYIHIEAIARGVFDGEIEDETGGATHYFSDAIAPPPWADPARFTRKIGHHLCYRLV
jgi:spore germination cell wall hydrolase CwlJ-like protein